MKPVLEICVDDLPGLEAAVAGGTDRIELCSALELGGLTPSAAFVWRAVATGLPVHVMIRPRAGDFQLHPGDLPMMADDIRLALDLGAAGIVVGALLPDNTLDQPALSALREVAGSAVLVLHRAIDLTPDPIAAIRAAHALGFDKVLTSGGTRTAVEGLATLRSMVAAASDGLAVIAGSGVRPENVLEIMTISGVREVHSSASSPAAAPCSKFQGFGFGDSRRTTDAAIVRRLSDAMQEMGK